MILTISNFKKLGIGKPLVINSGNGNPVLLRGINGAGKTSVKHAIGLCIYGPRLYKEAKRFFPKTNGADTTISIEGIPLPGGREVDVKRVIKFRTGDKDTLESTTFLDGEKVAEREVLALFPEIEAFMSVVSPEHFFKRPLVEQVRFLNSLIDSNVSEVEKSVVADEMDKITKHIEHTDADKAYNDAVDYLLAKYCLIPSGESFSFAKRESGDEVKDDVLPSFVKDGGKELSESVVKAMSSEFAKEFKESEGKLELLSEQQKQSLEKFRLLNISPTADSTDTVKAKEQLIVKIKDVEAEIITTDADLKLATAFDSSRTRIEGLKAGQRDLVSKYTEKKETFMASFEEKAKKILPSLVISGVKSAEIDGVPFTTDFITSVKSVTETNDTKKKIEEKKTERAEIIKTYTESFKDTGSTVDNAFDGIVASYVSEERKQALRANKDGFLANLPAFRINIEKKAHAILEEMKNGTEIPTEVRDTLILISKAEKEISVDGKKLTKGSLDIIKDFTAKIVASSVRPEASSEYSEHQKALEALAVLEGVVRDMKNAENKAKTETENKVRVVDAEIKALEESIKPDTSEFGEAVTKFIESSEGDVAGKIDAIRSLRAEFETERATFSEVFPYLKDYEAYEAGKRTYLLEKNSESLSKKLSSLRDKKDSYIKELSQHDVVAGLRDTYRSYDKDIVKYSEMKKNLAVLNVIYKGYHTKLWSIKRDKLAEIVEKKSNGMFRIVEDDARLTMEMRQSQ